VNVYSREMLAVGAGCEVKLDCQFDDGVLQSCYLADSEVVCDD
jgi:hypothetical protein